MGTPETRAHVLVSRKGVANLHSVLILGADAVAAASPASPVQLVHACHRWGFTTVVPASWGDELLASEVIRRCATRESRPAIQCSCPRVAERLGDHASKLDDIILWLATPPVAAAQYIRAHSGNEPVHVTYAGSCPGALDASIDQRVTPTELLLAISARGIDVTAQPTIFENVIPPDRRRHFSGAAGSPDPQRLWEAAAFRIAHPVDSDLAVGVAQLLLGEERILVDLGSSVGCVCRVATAENDSLAVLRSPTPVVRDGVVDVARAAPATRAMIPAPATARPPASGDVRTPDDEQSRPAGWVRRPSPARIVLRRSGAWRRPTPRPGAIVGRASGALMAVPETIPLLQRPEVRVAIATAIAVATLMLGVWIGRKNAPGADPLSRSAPGAPPAPLARPR